VNLANEICPFIPIEHVDVVNNAGEAGLNCKIAHAPASFTENPLPVKVTTVPASPLAGDGALRTGAALALGMNANRVVRSITARKTELVRLPLNHKYDIAGPLKAQRRAGSERR
jgi:hypothetical protein